MKTCHLTSKYEDKRHELCAPVRPKEKGALIHVDPQDRHQLIRGFGGAFTEAATYTLSRMPKHLRAEVLQACFDPKVGLRYNLGRVHIQSCDFALENYTYMDEGDTTLSSFSIDREKRYVIPAIKDAENIRGGPIDLLASPWSPPGWMKTTGRMNGGGKLLEEYRDLWAQCFVKFLDAYKKEGLSVFAVTVQNEPEATQTWDSCLYTGEEERIFVRDHLGPALAASEHEDTGIIIWDHNRDKIVERAKAVLEDAAAANHVMGVGVHWYVSEEFANLSQVHTMYPDKPIFFTEGCIEGGPRIESFETGEHYCRNMIGDFSNYCTAYIDWNLVLDEKGGPNHVGNYCDAPIIADTKEKKLHYNSSYHAIKHFSHHVDVGARRIGSTSDNKTIGHVAFLNPDGTIVVILQNETESDAPIRIRVGENEESLVVKRRSIVTLTF